MKDLSPLHLSLSIKFKDCPQLVTPAKLSIHHPDFISENKIHHSSGDTLGI